jgi:galactose mutarotase-like enzyme
MSATDAIVLRSAGANAQVARHCAELTSWTIGGRELMWSGDPQHWARSAPILFPVVGASSGGTVNIAGESFAMPQHGFARDSLFDVVEGAENAVTLQLTDNEATRRRYPFSFSFSVKYELAGENLSIDFEIENIGSGTMPYQLGFHPAFVWPFLADGKDGHELVFASDEPRPIHRPNAQGLLKRISRASVTGGRLAISDDLFEQGALVFADADSPFVTFTSPSGARLTIAVDGFPHWAVWTKPGAPFLSIEQWTGLPEWEDFKGELAERPSVSVAKPGERQRHSIRLNVMLP